MVNTPGRNASAVAEFTIGAILAETRLIRAGHEALRQGVWRGDLYRADLTGEELSEMTVGLIGYGHIGTRVVQAAEAVRLPHPGRRSLRAALAPRTAPTASSMIDLDTLLAESDVVSLHARVTEETTRLHRRARSSRG